MAASRAAMGTVSVRRAAWSRSAAVRSVGDAELAALVHDPPGLAVVDKPGDRVAEGEPSRLGHRPSSFDVGDEERHRIL
jgi:hypothetical protein